MDRIRFNIETSTGIYKVSSIYLSNDGSFKLDVPYAPFQSATFIKFPVDYSKAEMKIKIDDLNKYMHSKNRPQLSVHASGFVQFSGKGIRSGIDESTGLVKGIGVYSQPLITPINSGPTAALSLWGIEQYQPQNKIDKIDLIFNESHFIKRIYKNDPVDSISNTIFNTYTFDVFVFPEELKKGIRKSPSTGRLIMTLGFHNYLENPGAIFTFPVIELKNHTSFIGILPFKLYSDFAMKTPFGFTMAGPSGYELPENKGVYNTIISQSITFDLKDSLDYF